MTDKELKALLAELDEVVALRENLSATQARCTELITEARRYKNALRMIQEWDVLNPTSEHLCSDLPWLKELVDVALNGAKR